MKTIAFHNLGCKVNSYELDVMLQIMREKGYEIVPFDQKADVYVINTCTVTNIADRKSRQMLHRAKQKNPDAVVVAVGCYVQTDLEGINKDPAIDLAIGNNRKKDVAEIIERFLMEWEQAKERTNEAAKERANEAAKERANEAAKERTNEAAKERTNEAAKESEAVKSFRDKTLGGASVIDVNHTYEYEEMTLKTTAEHTRAYIKIQDGCNQFCSYCAIPLARGRVRSRRPENVIREIRGIVEAGYQEIVLTGIHISSYGIDLDEQGREILRGENAQTGALTGVEVAQTGALTGGEAAQTGALTGGEAAQTGVTADKPRDYRGESKLLELIEAIHEIPGLVRIRVSSLEPRIVTPETAKRLAALPKVCPHFHLSLQSGCDATLRRMNRHYTARQYLEGVEALRSAYAPRVPAITTDVIVGFPGETEEEFAETKAFLEKVGFYEMHIFKYSKRAGTRAAVMEGQIPEPVKADRSDVLLELERVQSIAFRKRKLGMTAEVLLEEERQIGGKTYFLGHTTDYVRVALPKEEIDAGNGLEGQRDASSESAPEVQNDGAMRAVLEGKNDGRRGKMVTARLLEFLTEDILLGHETDLF